MMKTIPLEPLSGAGPVRLTARRSEVLDALGPPDASFKKTPHSEHSTDSWHSGALQVFYSGLTPAVEYIEISVGTELEAALFGMNVFATNAEDLLRLLAEKTPVVEEESGHSYLYPQFELSLWREDRQAKAFSTVGIGVHGYYSGANHDA